MSRVRGIEGLLLLAWTGAAACGGGERAWSGTVTDSAGIAIVQNPETGIWPEGAGPAVTEELSIGTAEGDPDYQFAMITGLDVASDGSIAVLDMQSRQVKLYDAAGKYLRTLGGPGAGPGELSQFSVGLLVTAGDTVLVPDLGAQRLNRYLLDGTPIGEVATPIATGVAARWAERPDGQVLQEARIMKLPGMEDVEPKLQLIRRTPGGEMIDTLLSIPVGQPLEFATEGGQLSMQVRLFESEPVWALADDGRVFFAMNADYSISVYSPEARLERIVRKDVERKPLTDSDRQAFMTLLKKQWEMAGVPPQAMDMLMNSVGFAEYYPAFANLLGGPDGSLWVQRIRTAADVEEGVEFDPQDAGAPDFDVFDREGRYMGVVNLPDHFTPIRVIGDRIYGIWRDDLDVQHVKVLRVTMPAE